MALIYIYFKKFLQFTDTQENHYILLHSSQ